MSHDNKGITRGRIIRTQIRRRIENPTPMVHSSAVLCPGQIVRTKEEHRAGANYPHANSPADKKPDANGSPFGVRQIHMTSLCFQFAEVWWEE